jgi:hypothetical protein
MVRKVPSLRTFGSTASAPSSTALRFQHRRLFITSCAAVSAGSDSFWHTLPHSIQTFFLTLYSSRDPEFCCYRYCAPARCVPQKPSVPAHSPPSTSSPYSTAARTAFSSEPLVDPHAAAAAGIQGLAPATCLTGYPQAHAAPAGSLSQPLCQAYAPPPPAMAAASPGPSTSSLDSYEVLTLRNWSSFMTTATSNSLPTLLDLLPSPEPVNLTPYMTQHMGQHMSEVQPGLGGMANIMRSQTMPVSPVHSHLLNRNSPRPTKMAVT